MEVGGMVRFVELTPTASQNISRELGRAMEGVNLKRKNSFLKALEENGVDYAVVADGEKCEKAWTNEVLVFETMKTGMETYWGRVKVVYFNDTGTGYVRCLGFYERDRAERSGV
jgi:hypothetical protein